MDYTGLQSYVASVLDRGTSTDDPDFWAQLPTFIENAESENRTLRHYRMLTRATNTTTAEYIGLPLDWVEGQTVVVTANGRQIPLAFAPPQQANSRKMELPVANVPQYYTVIGTEMRFIPNPASVYPIEMTYWAKIPALTVVSPTNWLIQEYQNVYVYGTLIQATAYTGEDERLPNWVTLYENAKAQADLEGDAAQIMSPIEVPALRTF